MTMDAGSHRTIRRPFRVRLITLLVLASFSFLASFATGCYREPPSKLKTYLARGTVKFKDGVPLGGGIIEFKSVQDETLTISSPIGSDGSFELKTLDGNHNLAGAVQGTCRVIVTLPIVSADPPTIFFLQKTEEVKASDNEFSIVLPVNSDKGP